MSSGVFFNLWARPFAARAVMSLSAAALLLPGCTRRESPADNGADEVRPVRVARAVTQPLEEVVLAVGSLMPFEEVNFSPKVPGRIDEILVDLGSPVKAGDVVATLESREYELRARQAEATLAEAQARLGIAPEATNAPFDLHKVSSVQQARAVFDEAESALRRARALADQGILPESELEAASAAHTVAENRYRSALEEARMAQAVLSQRQAELAMAQQQVAETRLVAPFDGVIRERFVSPGEYVTVGRPVASLVRVDRLRLRLEISERDAGKMRVGQPVRVYVEGLTNRYAGQIRRVSPALDERWRMLAVEAEVENDGQIRAGTAARAAEIVVANTPGLVVPENAIVTFAGINKVFVVEDGKTREQLVRLGRKTNNLVEIVEGISEGVSVVLDPENLYTGQKVSILTGQPGPGTVAKTKQDSDT